MIRRAPVPAIRTRDARGTRCRTVRHLRGVRAVLQVVSAGSCAAYSRIRYRPTCGRHLATQKCGKALEADHIPTRAEAVPMP